MIKSRLALRPTGDPVLRRFRAAVDELYGKRIERIVLFGSRARGDHQPDSDYDIAVFIKDPGSFYEENHRLAVVTTDIQLTAGADISAIPFRAGSAAMTTTILPTPDAIDRAAGLLRKGELVAFPTETVYGLGGDATDEAAVARIFAAKGRPRFNPLIVHVLGLAEAEALAAFDRRARLAARRFWPGPLSLVLPRRPGCGLALLASAGLDTIALRAPAHTVAQALLRAAGRPIAAPSANRSGRVSPTIAAHVAGEFAGEGLGPAMILDAGPCPVGIESTVLDLTGATPALLRAGDVTLEELNEVFGAIEVPTTGEEAPRAPGRLASHYAPGLPVRLDAMTARPGEALLAFGPEAPPGFAEMLFLSRSGDLAEAAANLFAMLRRLDRPEFAGIAVMPIPEIGLGRAINDRLRRAAAPHQ